MTDRSEAIKRALAGRKAAGVQLGHRSTVPETTRAMIATLRASGMTWMQVASRLNADGVPTPSGRGSWHPTSAKRHLGVLDE